MTKSDPVFHLRVLLNLGRVSNLPTVWSNCLAGWLLSGGGDSARFNLVLLGATFIYLGGMYLNDAFDAGFDRQHRRERPIPSGLIGVDTVWVLGFGWLALGGVILALLGRTTGLLSATLIITVILYDAVHKTLVFSPVLMAACRFWLYLVAGSTAAEGLGGLTIWSGFAMAGYVVGISYIARRESTPGILRWWPIGFLVTPVLLAVVVNGRGYQAPAGWLSLLLSLWVVRCLRHSFGEPQRDLQRTVTGLLAGIIWVDLLAIGGDSVGTCMIFASLFGLTLLSQRYVPAT